MEKNSSRNIVQYIIALSSFIIPFLGSSVNIALPAIGSEFGMNTVSMGWISTAYLLAAGVFLVPFGRIADIHGRKRIFLYGMLIVTLASLLCGVSGSESLLLIFRVLQGFGSSMVFSTGIAILTSVFPPEKRGKAMGINVAFTYAGLSTGPVIGGFLTQYFSWRSIFFLSVLLGVFIILTVLLKLKDEWAEAQTETFRIIDSLFYAMALFGVMYGFLLLPGILGAILIIVGLLGFVGFGLLQSRSKSPILDLIIFKGNRSFVLSNLAALINYSATFAVGFLLSLYLQYIKGFDPRTAGLVLVIQPAIQALLSPYAGRLSDRSDPHKISSLGMLLTVAGLLMMIFISEGTSILYIGLGLALLGVGFAFFSSPNTSAIMNSVEKRFYGVASGIVGTMRLIGQVFSMGTATLVFALHMGKVIVTPQYFGKFIESSSIIFIILSILCFAGVFASLARVKRA